MPFIPNAREDPHVPTLPQPLLVAVSDTGSKRNDSEQRDHSSQKKQPLYLRGLEHIHTQRLSSNRTAHNLSACYPRARSLPWQGKPTLATLSSPDSKERAKAAAAERKREREREREREKGREEERREERKNVHRDRDRDINSRSR